MCQMVVFWYACAHLIVSYMTCPFEEARNHKEQTATTALVDVDCWICQQYQQHPTWGASRTMKRLLMTVQNMEYILGVPADEDGFLDMVARFYARGDHKRWVQPGVAKAKYSKDDPYVRDLEVQSYLCTRGQKDFHINPGYAFDILLAMMKHWDRADYSDLNWSMTGYRPPSDFFYVSSSMIGMLSDGHEADHGQRTGARRSRCLPNDSSVVTPTPSTISPVGIGESAQIGFGHLRADSSTQGPLTQPPLDAQTSSVQNVNSNPGPLFPRRPCEALHGSPVTMKHYTQHILQPLSPLGEPGPSIESHSQALDERVSHHACTSSVFHPILPVDNGGDIGTNEASQEVDLHYRTRSNPFTYDDTFPTENALYTSLNQIYTVPDTVRSSLSPAKERTRRFSKSHNPTEDHAHFGALLSSPTLGTATIDSNMLNLNNFDQLYFPGDGTCGDGKGKQPIRGISPPRPRVPGGFLVSPLPPDSMDISPN
ncbi:hypothetical protein BDV26DRAFT_299025 [Aspergillus bertholletiae]|uniref:Uncharacterized protein n=1 Tax=Aspergillus bertholletiae TaxID=1226010 RepID=A0A5N7AQ99_9EURO|nr:hypothetical protein BDV26DRAFT_299025 [Aspergillus bertholletiae]